MEELTLILLTASIGLFLARYPLKKKGVDILCLVASVCATASVLTDPALQDQYLIIALMPLIAILFMCATSLAFDNARY